MIKNKIIKEDCVTGMKLLDKSSIDVIITSPPYNLNINYGIYKDDLPRNSYLNWLNDVFIEIARVMKEDGHFFLNVGYSNIDPWVGLDAANVARKHFVLQNNITWVKSIHVGDKTYGHFKPINSNRFSNPTWEHLFHFTKSGNTVCDKLAIGVPYTDKSNIERFSQVSDNRCRGNTWFIPYETIRSRQIYRGSHPATFPTQLVDYCIKFSGKKTGILLDPFMGSGTSAIAAIRNKLDYIGYDIDQSYIDFAEDRIKEETKLSNLFE